MGFDLGCVSLRKSKIGFLNPKESENGFRVSLLNRSIQDLSDHGASKEKKNLLPVLDWILPFVSSLRQQHSEPWKLSKLRSRYLLS